MTLSMKVEEKEETDCISLCFLALFSLLAHLQEGWDFRNTFVSVKQLF